MSDTSTSPRLNFPSISASRNSVAAFAFLTWDILITIADEVEYIWQKPIVYTTYIYVFVRYFAWISQVIIVGGVDVLVSTHREPSSIECRSWLIWQTVSAQVEVTSVELILIMRVHALYGRSRKVLMRIGVLYAIEIIAMTVSLVISIVRSHSTVNCETLLPLTIVGYGLASFLFQTLLLVMLSYKVFGSLRSVRILQVMLRDGLWAYALMSVVIFTNILLYGLVKNALSAACFPWLMSTSSFVGYRLLLNLRKEAYPERREEIEADRRSADIEFTTFSDSTRGQDNPCVT